MVKEDIIPSTTHSTLISGTRNTIHDPEKIHNDVVTCTGRKTMFHFFRNSFHAFITIGKTDGLLALQKGLVPALWYQMFMNGVRLGSYQIINNSGVVRTFVFCHFCAIALQVYFINVIVTHANEVLEEGLLESFYWSVGQSVLPTVGCI